MKQKTRKPKLVRIEKRIVTPVLKVPVKLLGCYTLYYAPVKVKDDLEIEDDVRVDRMSRITGLLKIKGKEGDVIDVYQVKSEEMLFPPRFFSSRTRWIFKDGLWTAIFTQVFSNTDGVTNVCYCYSSNTDECNCGAETGEED